ncbi:hypothetical protein [Desulforamulus ruminis]|uniref:Lipoprotein n=1 Tax=Desulforamulus ruminis (strain ATCC 23193 / DSM 2154 / NCIMB 8452 / DL) TaxID=696281 RepID=F6DKF3_DESRL|nr:hypothetical protein [Desulforamulus ruminis]AEG59213.1 hypothetical protein Desru_0937 [Desulforamulus ruminis DSM 2154]
MKFPNLIRVLLFIFISTLVVGCSNTAETAQKTPQENSSTADGSEKITMPEGRPTLMGKVKEIIGNEVTVYIAQAPQNEEAPKEEATKQPQTEESSQPNQRAGNRGFAMNFTEETKTFIIPVGVPIVTMQRGSAEVSDVGLTGVKKDAILRIWEQDGAISFVQVTGGGGQTGNRQGTGSNGAGGGANGPGGMGGMGGPPPGMGGNR